MKTIFIVEDEALVALDLRSRLEALGYSVAGTASSGREAVMKIAETRPDLVIMDIVLQGEMDGIEVAERIRDLKVPVVFLTAYSDPETIGRARRAGAYGYLLKPYDDNSLNVTVKTALRRYEADLRGLGKKPPLIDERDRRVPEILVVEDEAIIAADLKEKLEGLGYRVSGVEDTGEGAVEAAGELKPDLVLMDVYLRGEMDGIEAARMIQGRYRIPVVYLTAYSDDETLSRILESEPYGYLLKPFSREQLQAEVEVTLEAFSERLHEMERFHEIISTKEEELKIEKTGVFFVSSVLISLALYGFITGSMTWLMYLLFIPVVYSFIHLFMSIGPRWKPPEDHERPMVSIVVPAHDEENTIKSCVETLSSLDYMKEGERNYEIIVVDDASRDRTGEILRELAGSLSHLHVVTRKPPFAFTGKGYALNDALTVASGDVVAVFDADARVEPDFLERTVPYLEGEDVAGVQSRVKMYNRGRNLLTMMQHIEFAVFGNLILESRMRMGVPAFLGGNGQLVKRKAIESIGGWDGYAITEDLNMSIKLMLEGYNIRYCPEAAVWQEAVPQWDAFFRQRVRWLTGNLETLFIYLAPMIDAPIPLHRKLDSIFYLFGMLFIGFVMLGYIVFILNAAQIYLFRFEAPLIIGLLSTVAFFPLTMAGILRDGYSVPRSLLLSLEYWAYCLYLIPLFIMAFIYMIRRHERRWAKTRHHGDSG